MGTPEPVESEPDEVFRPDPPDINLLPQSEEGRKLTRIDTPAVSPPSGDEVFRPDSAYEDLDSKTEDRKEPPTEPGSKEIFRPDAPDVDPFPQSQDWKTRATRWTGESRRNARKDEEKERLTALAARAEAKSGAPGSPVAPPPRAPAEEPEKESQGLKSWSGAGSSVPTLRSTRPIEPPPELEHAHPVMRDDDFPVDDPRLLAAAAVLAGASADSLPPNPVTPSISSLWWNELMHQLRTSRRAQIYALVLGVLLLAGMITYWPHSSPTVSIASLLSHPKTYDGHAVRVGGRIGDVYPVGGGWAFYLQQGKSTIVVFTRSRRPHPQEEVVVEGMVSTGYLDGAPRPAVFENN